jgi:ubiquinone/menaquinone biosynthesis C-methylase UbiE
MVDRQFADAEMAALYDALDPPEGREDFRFYLRYVMRAEAVLDVGCGTGALLRLARDAGHTGRLSGLDPGPGMLEQARKRTDIEWILGDLQALPSDAGFDLIVMTGHAFQVLVTDEEIAGALSIIHAALTDGGRFVFETRNPAARAWEQWTPADGVDFVDPSGAAARFETRLDAPFDGNVVRFTSTWTSARWSTARVSSSTLRFLDPGRLGDSLADAGLAIDEQFGDWQGGPFEPTSAEIITIARVA